MKRAWQARQMLVVGEARTEVRGGQGAEQDAQVGMKVLGGRLVGFNVIWRRRKRRDGSGRGCMEG